MNPLTFVFICGLIVLLWYVFVFWIHYHSRNSKNPIAPKNEPPSVSILIAARNEEKQIKDCLEAIIQNNYPGDKVEIIVVDDHSDDNTCNLIQEVISKNQKYNLRVYSATQGQGKKSALSMAVSNAKGEYRLVTDADCLVPPNWIEHMCGTMASEGCEAVFGPVLIPEVSNWLGKWQQFDQAHLMLVTNALFQAGVPIMASAANMGFHRKLDPVFHKSVIESPVKSGDDVFFLHEILRNSELKISFLPGRQVIVQTVPLQTLKDLVQQRIRWASKAKYYRNSAAIATGGFLLTVQLIFLISPVLACLVPESALFIVLLWLLKISVEYILHFKFLQENNLNKGLIVPLSSLLYPLYAVTIGFASILIKNITWKGRTQRA